MNEANLILLINFFAYLFLFIAYQKKKKVYDLGSVLLTVWVVGSLGAIWYYSFPYVPKMYSNITILPLVYLFVVNLYLIRPFCKCNYKEIYSVNINNLRDVLRKISVFFSVIAVPPVISIIIKMLSYNFGGAGLAEMYGEEVDKATLLFPSYIKPFYSIIRHFTQFIVFLFFYNLGVSGNGQGLIRIGLGLNVVLFLCVALMGGSRGGMLLYMLSCAYYYFFMKHTFDHKIRRWIKRLALFSVAAVFIGVSVISLSRFNTTVSNKGSNKTMDLWIAQYAGEGILRFDDIAWNLEEHMYGYQTMPVVASLFDERVKDLDSMILKYDRLIGSQIWMFDTYLGDLLIDYGRVGGFIAAILIGLIIRYLIKCRNGKISMFKLVILNYFFLLLSIGITADVYRTYYTQIEIVYVLTLLGILYVLNSFIPNYAKFRIGNNNTCI